MKPSTSIPENHLNRDEFIGGIVIFFFGGVTVLLSANSLPYPFHESGRHFFYPASYFCEKMSDE